MATEAVFMDALGTVVELEPPWPHLAAALGIAADERVVTAVRAEMAYYRDHAHEGTDEPALAELRRRCASLLSAELGREVSVEQMMSSIRFRAYPDAPAALAVLRARGLRLACVSNWDVSLPQVLEHCGLGAAFDVVVTSAGAGSRKPIPRSSSWRSNAAVAGPDRCSTSATARRRTRPAPRPRASAAC